MYQPQTGDILKTFKGGFIHYGIYLGEGRVFHNTPPDGEHVVYFDRFANQHPVTCIALPFEKRQEVLSRTSESLRNAKKYNLLFNNCEHTVTKILTGTAYSPQLRGAVGILCVVALLVGVLFVAGKNSA